MITKNCKNCDNEFKSKYSIKLFCSNDCNINYHNKNRNISSHQIRNGVLKHLYGISITEWNELFKKQKGCCAICNTHQSKFKTRLCVDHNHITNKVRGLLCHNCNVGIGKLKADQGDKNLKSAIKYIKENK